MNDFLSALALVVIVALALAFSHPSGVVRWARDEWRLMRARTWGPAPSLPTDILTRKDPRCRRVVIRQRALGAQLRRQGVAPRVAMSSAGPAPARFPRTTR